MYIIFDAAQNNDNLYAAEQEWVGVGDVPGRGWVAAGDAPRWALAP